MTYLRRVDKNKHDEYNRYTTREEKLNSALVADLRNYSAVSLYRSGSMSELRIVLGSLSNARHLDSLYHYVLLPDGDIIVLCDEAQSMPTGALSDVNALHYDHTLSSDDAIIDLADKIARSELYPVSKQDIINEAWNCINNEGIPESAFRFLKNV